ncbi:MAG TPA: M43 family zinc metalloprotease [Bacteroidia bacterium]
MKKLFFLALTMLLVANAKAQCLTDKVNYDILKQNVEMMIRHQQLYENVPPVSNTKRATKYIIPVVFHVIHTNGSENISKEQIEDQIRILNLDYSYTNANKGNIRSIFQGVAANFEIEFRLAKIDPQGNCTDGINRVYSSKHINAGDAVKKLPLARWPNEQYLNIWTVSSINSSGAPGTILGYAYFPSTSQGVTYSALDGVIVRSDYVGSIGTSDASKAGRVLTHEIGHYLGLLHPFQDSCDGGDHCDDTPPVYGTFTNANCNPTNNSCHNDNPDLPDMFENYMDYSAGNCQAMFTLDQKSIVYNTFEMFEHRKKMVSAANLAATGVADQTGAPLAGFTSDLKVVCPGTIIQFYETSCKSPVTSRTWTFEGGNINSSTISNPKVTYATPGKYKVTLKVDNSSGSNTIEREQYITVLPTEAIDKGYLIQTFESPDFQDGEGWILPEEEGETAFKRVTDAAYGGNACLKADISALDRKGKLYRIISPKVDMRPLAGKGPKLSFMVAYAQPNTKSQDVLKVYSSVDCGNTWVLRYSKTTTGLYSTTFAEHNFVPDSINDWKRHSINLAFAQNEPNAMFMIEVESDAGGPLYIDNINVSQYNTGIEPVIYSKDLQVYPVPAHNQANLSFDAGVGGVAQIEIINTLGQIISSRNYEVNEGVANVSMDVSALSSKGIHFIQVNINGVIYQATLILE